jgi:hypothetical protein
MVMGETKLFANSKKLAAVTTVAKVQPQRFDPKFS